MKADPIYQYEVALESVTLVGSSAAIFEFRDNDHDVYMMTVPIEQLKSLLKEPEAWLGKTFQKSE